VVSKVENWSHFTSLLFSVAKFSLLAFFAKPSFNPDTSVYTVNGNPIKTTLQHKDLGITFIADLNWAEHYKIITARSYQMLGVTFIIDHVEAK